MRISMRAEEERKLDYIVRVTRALGWVKKNENIGGGIAAWTGYKSYPEVSGYLIPSLLAYNETELCKRLADWLVSIQHKDGSFDGIDGVKRVFDTGAIMEGLYAVGRKKEADKARVWIQSQRNKDKTLKSQPDQERSNFYNMRVEGLLGNKDAVIPSWFEDGKQRTHYLAYGLEGLYALGVDITEYLGRLPSSGIMPAYVDSDWKSLSGTDTTATAQIGILKLKNGLAFDPSALYALQMDNGGLPHDTGDSRQISWAVKFFLDLERIINAD